MHNLSYLSRTVVRKPQGVVFVVGQGVRLRVRRHALEILDGFPLEGPPRSRAVHRATAPVERILFLAGSGFVTVDALDWAATNGAPIVAVDQSGALRWTLLPGKGGEWACRLRRAQALVPFTETGLEIARWLIARKLAGQRDTLRELGRSPDSVEMIAGAIAGIEGIRSIPHLRILEAQVADVYWKAWVGLPVHFAPPSYVKKIPAHWTTFRGRGSPLSGGPRNAVDPVGALLNYAYALLEAEARIACHEAGLDPYLGILHTDRDTRRSLLYDVMEPARPVADRLVLNLLGTHAFRPGELWALRDGRCRLDQDLCARMWPWMPEFRKALGPVMTFLLSRLRQGARYTERTGLRLVEVTPEVKAHAPLGRKRWTKETDLPPLQPAGVCRSCGVLLEGLEDRLYCDYCLPLRRKESTASMSRTGRETLGRLRGEGRDPAHGGTAARARGEKIGHHNRERGRWRDAADGAADPSVYRREILPRLRRVPLSRIARAVGVSEGYASFIRRGLRIPHPRHWEALRALAHRRGGETMTTR